ncbi:MAG: hypothetical protein SF123_18985 [Chloroflexota bacterium]|nr:hypothetical protein [Chloroflexota bacterium]
MTAPAKDGWYSIDIFSCRIDPTAAMVENLLWTQSPHNAIDSIDTAGDANATSKCFHEWMF